MERTYIDALPEGFDLQGEYPHNRNPWARDHTCFNPSKTKFVAAFNIYEHSMMNEMGRVIWGSSQGNAVQVQGFMEKHLVYCWEQPFAHWLDDDCFAIKIDSGKQHYPIVVIHLEKGFQIISKSEKLETRASQFRKEDLSNIWLPNENELQS